MDYTQAAVVTSLAAGASFTQSVSGFGFSLLLVPPLSLVIGPKEAVVTATLMGMLTSALTIATSSRSVDWRLGTLLSGSAALGMPVGLLILAVINPTVLQAGMAVIVLLATWLVWRGVRATASNMAADLGAGFLSGMLGTSTSMTGPPVVLHFHSNSMPADKFKGTINAYFLAGAVLAVVLFLFDHRIGIAQAHLALIATPVICVAWLIGHRSLSQLDPQRFRKITLLVLFASGILALAGALTPW